MPKSKRRELKRHLLQNKNSKAEKIEGQKQGKLALFVFSTVVILGIVLIFYIFS